MIEVKCGCGGWRWVLGEAQQPGSVKCRKCGAALSVVAAEQLPPDAGAGDFDAYIEVVSGPARVGERIFLGGVAEIGIGRQDGQAVQLRGSRVSRQHCRLVRDDFGPSRWRVVDNPSTHGLFVGGRRVAEKELSDGDVVRVGEYELRYGHTVEAPAPAAVPAMAMAIAMAGAASQSVGVGGKTCPSCEKPLSTKAKICVDCGIKVDTGRPVLTSQGRDEDALHVQAETWIKVVSWIVPLTPLPIPIASEAFGRRKPYVTWAIAAITIVASVAFFVATAGSEDRWDTPGKNLMLWPVSGKVSIAPALTGRDVRRLIAQMDAEERAEFEKYKQDLRGTVPDGELDRRALQQMMSAMMTAIMGEPGEFHAYQLVTHAFLHDTSSIFGLALHLAGNMLFLLVFGSRVNALLGNVAMIVLYPILAIAAALAHVYIAAPTGPMLGASGAVMGLAGMYLILFPVHRVYCSMWLRLRLWCAHTVFPLRGFWLLIIYFAYDAGMAALKFGGNVAHWAHIGGFVTGAVISLGLLFSRTCNCGGGDILSVALGKGAWCLIGKPGRWNAKSQPDLRAAAA
jgi:membrane associated rhomboid family serine protease